MSLLALFRTGTRHREHGVNEWCHTVYCYQTQHSECLVLTRWKEAIITLREALVSKMSEYTSPGKSVAYTAVFSHITLSCNLGIKGMAVPRCAQISFTSEEDLPLWSGDVEVWKMYHIHHILHGFFSCLVILHVKKNLHLVANLMLSSFGFPPLISVTCSDSNILLVFLLRKCFSVTSTLPLKLTSDK